jgi:hypothetical protein
MSLTAGQLFLSSYNNQDGQTSTDFSLTLSVPVTKAKRLRLLGATIPNLFMPFGPNDKLWSFTVNTTTYTMNFPTTRRWATIGDFVTYTNATVFTSASPSTPPVTLSYDANSNQLILTGTVAGSKITMPGWAWNNNQGTSVSYNANYRLGWTNAAPVIATSTAPAFPVLRADGFPNVFNRTNVLYVVTNIAATSNNDNNIGNVLGRIPVNIGWGGVINYENIHTDFSGEAFASNFKEVTIQVLDEDYQPLINPNNAYFSLVVGVHYE